ncbi:MAG: VCBS repeat-containing protein [Gammaproteobacteria bacterium]
MPQSPEPLIPVGSLCAMRLVFDLKYVGLSRIRVRKTTSTTSPWGMACLVWILLLGMPAIAPMQVIASDSSAAGQNTASIALTEEELEAQRQQYISHYCGGCHLVPSPATLPRSIWPDVVQEMAVMAEDRFGEPFITPEVVNNVIDYYLNNAPESLPPLPLIPDKPGSFSFHEQAFGAKSRISSIMNIHKVDLGLYPDGEFLVSDGDFSNVNNSVSLLYRQGDSWHEQVLLYASVPVHTEVVDFDGDGDRDIIVAALGALPPVPAKVGKVILLRQESRGVFAAEILLDNVGRVTDARPVDIDGDGDYDIAVAIYGSADVGEIAWLENLGAGQFQQHTILRSPGALNVSLTDLDQDGKTDLVSLMAQEHEAVVGLLNKGEGQFETVLLARAMHPVSGSTSMRLVDLDRDGDEDILFTNGDANDFQPDPKPYHGVQWLENKGSMEFQLRDIGRFYGAVSAAADDMDGDGDLDIVVSSWNNFWEEPGRQTMLWFENDGQQQFTPHRLLGPTSGIVSFELADVTDDGRLDIVAGLFDYGNTISRHIALGYGRPDPTLNIQGESDRFLLITREVGDSSDSE